MVAAGASCFFRTANLIHRICWCSGSALKEYEQSVGYIRDAKVVTLSVERSIDEISSCSVMSARARFSDSKDDDKKYALAVMRVVIIGRGTKPIDKLTKSAQDGSLES